MRIGKVLLLWTVLAVIAAIASVLLALKSEGIAYQYFVNGGTPGMLLARRFVPPSPRLWDVELTIDVALWFSVLYGSALAFMWRRKKRSGVP